MMLLRLIEDMNKALDHDCFFAALSLALTLPDICGKAMCPDEKSGKKRYITWYDEHVGKYEQYPGAEGKMPYLSGEVVYQLRCSFLHEGSSNIDTNKIEEDCCKVNEFTLLTEKKKPYNALVSTASVESDLYHHIVYKSYEVNVRQLCMKISESAKRYYEANREAFSSFDFNVVDLDERIK